MVVCRGTLRADTWKSAPTTLATHALHTATLLPNGEVDACKGGACVGGNPLTCPAEDTCHAVGACDPVTGICSHPTLPDGAACDDGDACTQTDACAAGVCIGSSPALCQAKDDCHKVGVCNPGTGVCSQPTKANGSGCDDGDACTTKDRCQAGVCKGMAPVVCVALDECHEAGACAEATGACSDPVKMDGTTCTGGTCQSGVCVPVGGTTTTATTGAGAGGGTGAGGSDGSGGGGDSSGGCGCETVGSARAPVVPSAWGLGVLFAASALRRRRRESARR